MPRASDSTTSTSENLSITSPGRKSASPKITRQLDISTVFFLYSQASFTRCFKNSPSISCLLFRVSRRTSILEFRLIKPLPIGYPSKSWITTISPSVKEPMMLSISLSKIHTPPALMVRPSPFFSVTIASFISIYSFLSHL